MVFHLPASNKYLLQEIFGSRNTSHRGLRRWRVDRDVRRNLGLPTVLCMDVVAEIQAA